MTDAPVIGSASFELRATRDKLKADLAQAERETRAEMKRVEEAAKNAQKELKRAFSDAGQSEFERSMRVIRNASEHTEDEVRAAADRVARDLKGRYRDLGADIGRTFSGVSRAAQLAFAGITAYGLKLAADAGEIESAFEVAFGTAEAKARSFSDTLADEVGRDAVVLREQMTRLQLVLTGTGVAAETAAQMVEALTRSGVDAGSLFNTSDAEALQKIISGLTGETEPLKAFGVVISQAAVEAELLRLGFEGNAAEADEAAKSIARANLIIKGLSVAQGDATRTADSASNTTKRMTAEFNKAARELGQELLPAMTQVFGAATNVLKAFNDLPGGVQVAGLAFLGLIAAGGPIAGLLVNLNRLRLLAIETRVALAAMGGGSAAGAAAGGAAAGTAAGLAARAVPVVGAGAAVLSLGGDTARRGRPTDEQQLAGARGGLEEAERRLAEAQRRGDERAARVHAETARRYREGTQIIQNRMRAAENARLEADAAAAVVDQARAAGINAPGASGDTSLVGGFGLPPSLRRPTGGGGGGGASAPGGSAPAERDVAALREALDLQNQLEIARASGNSEAIRGLERQQDLARLTAEFQRAGYDDAAARAETHLDNLEAARTKAEQIADWERQSLEFWEQLGEAVRRENDLLLERLGFEAEIARLEGDPDRIKQRERDLFVQSRINELLEARRVRTRAEAQAQAEDEWRRLDQADVTGRMRDEFRYAFTDGIKAAIDGDLGSFFENLADRFTDRMLDNLADDLFDLLNNAMKDTKSDGGGFFSNILSGIGSFFGFGGGRAAGGPMLAGFRYRAGEHGPEDIIMPMNGFAIPNGALAQAGAGQARGTRGGNNYYFSGNLLTPEFWAQIQNEVSAGEARAYGRAMTDAPKVTMSQTARTQTHSVGRRRR